MRRRKRAGARWAIALACAGTLVPPAAWGQAPSAPASTEGRSLDPSAGELLPQLRLAEPEISDENAPEPIDGAAAPQGALSETVNRPRAAGDDVERPSLGASDEPSGGGASAAAGSPTDGFDLFSGPERPASELATPSAPVQPVARETTPSSAAVASGLRGTEPGDARRGFDPVPGAADPIRTGATARPLGRIEDARPDLFGRTNLPAGTLRNPLPRIDPDDPFAALGIRLGSLLLYPTLIQTFGASSNLDALPGGESGAFSETTLSGRLLSDWSRHEAEVNASASYRRNFSGVSRDNPRLSADGRLRFDFDADTTATLRGAIAYERDDPIESFETGGLGERPSLLDATASAEIERAFGRAGLRGTASLARSAKTNLAPGSADEDYLTATGALRASYEVSPALRPFVEASLGRRAFDEAPVPGSPKPDATLAAARAGVTLEISEKLFGELALGYGWSTPDDDAFRETRSPTVDASLNWSPQRGTDVVLAAATRFEPDPSGLSSETVIEGSLGISHRLGARTDLSALAVVEHSDSDVPNGDETLYAIEGGFTYWLNRTLALTGLARHETSKADDPASDYEAATIQLGLRMQR